MADYFSKPTKPDEKTEDEEAAKGILPEDQYKKVIARYILLMIFWL